MVLMVFIRVHSGHQKYQYVRSIRATYHNKSHEFHNGDTFFIMSNFNFYISSILKKYHHLINNRRMFNVGIDDLVVKPYISHKSLLQWICCKCLVWWHRHSYFWPQRSWRLLEAKNTIRRPKKAWKSWFIKKSI